MKKVLVIALLSLPVLVLAQTRNIVPRANNEGTLGTVSKAWSGVYVASTGVFGSSVTASAFYGDGSHLTGISTGSLSGAAILTDTQTFSGINTFLQNIAGSITGNAASVSSGGVNLSTVAAISGQVFTGNISAPNVSATYGVTGATASFSGEISADMITVDTAVISGQLTAGSATITGSEFSVGSSTSSNLTLATKNNKVCIGCSNDTVGTTGYKLTVAHDPNSPEVAMFHSSSSIGAAISISTNEVYFGGERNLQIGIAPNDYNNLGYISHNQSDGADYGLLIDTFNRVGVGLAPVEGYSFSAASIFSQSSATASAFYGDGSHLTGIASGSLDPSSVTLQGNLISISDLSVSTAALASGLLSVGVETGTIAGNLASHETAIAIDTTTLHTEAISVSRIDLSTVQPAGNYITALTGDVTASGPGSAAATVAHVPTEAVDLSTVAAISGQVFTGNVTAPNLTATYNLNAGSITWGTSGQLNVNGGNNFAMPTTISSSLTVTGVGLIRNLYLGSPGNSSIQGGSGNGGYIDFQNFTSSTFSLTSYNNTTAATVFNFNARPSASQDLFAIQKSGEFRLLMNTNGNIGIGTTSPSERLHVYNGNIRATYGIIAATGTFTSTVTAGDIGATYGMTASTITVSTITVNTIVDFGEVAVSSTCVNDLTCTVSCAAGYHLISGGCQFGTPELSAIKMYPNSTTTFYCGDSVSPQAIIASGYCAKFQ